MYNFKICSTFVADILTGNADPKPANVVNIAKPTAGVKTLQN
jgi:hypothetical protein